MTLWQLRHPMRQNAGRILALAGFKLVLDAIKQQYFMHTNITQISSVQFFVQVKYRGDSRVKIAVDLFKVQIFA